MRTTVKLGGLLAALVAAVWVTARVTTPEHVRLFDELHGELEGHAGAVRSGAIQPDDDPNRIVRYPVGGGLRKHAVVCIRRGEVLTYSVGAMERPFDGGSPHRHYYVTPYDRQRGACALPKQLGTYFYRYEVFDQGRWAYWFGG